MRYYIPLLAKDYDLYLAAIHMSRGPIDLVRVGGECINATAGRLTGTEAGDLKVPTVVPSSA